MHISTSMFDQWLFLPLGLIINLQESFRHFDMIPPPLDGWCIAEWNVFHDICIYIYIWNSMNMYIYIYRQCVLSDVWIYTVYLSWSVCVCTHAIYLAYDICVSIYIYIYISMYTRHRTNATVYNYVYTVHITDMSI